MKPIHPSRLSLHGLLLLLILLGAAHLPGQADAPTGETLPNLQLVKEQIIHWHDSGAYDAEIAAVDAQAQAYLETRVKAGGSKLAVVFDIDETSLSNWPHLRQYDFGYVPEAWLSWEHESAAWPIVPTLKLYRYAHAAHVATFFVTSRPDTERDFTERNLESAGYEGWDGLYLKGPDSPPGPSVIPFKSGARKTIAERGYDIAFSIGDQMSDLAGGYADRTFKLPNPMYYIP